MALVWDALISRDNPSHNFIDNWCSTVVNTLYFCYTMTDQFGSQTATVGAGFITFIVQLFYAYRLWIREGSLLVGAMDYLLTGIPKLANGAPGFRESL